jgi:RNA polymerase sigma factor (sigma-70 family)
LPRVRRFACSLTGNRDDADDLMQSTLVRVLERGVPDGADLLRWMFRVCRNLWIDELRPRTVRGVAGEAPGRAVEPAVDGEAALLRELTVREVTEAMQALPEEQRALISLVAVEGLTYREASEVLKIPMGTVMSRLARARAALARHLARHPSGARTET